MRERSYFDLNHFLPNFVGKYFLCRPYTMRGHAEYIDRCPVLVVQLGTLKIGSKSEVGTCRCVVARSIDRASKNSVQKFGLKTEHLHPRKNDFWPRDKI